MTQTIAVRLIWGVAAALLALAVWQFRETLPVARAALPERDARAAIASGAAPIMPLPESVSLDPRKVALGSRLFHDRRLSRPGTVACADCHALEKGGVDGLKHSVGITGQPGHVNAPTVFNAAFNFRQFWNGRALSLEEQIDGPLQDPGEMGSDWPTVIARLKSDGDYSSAFATIYPDGIAVNNVKDAIATFERSLVTPNSRFDRYLRGDANAITGREANGYRLFRHYGCVACHQGMNVGGNMFAPLGIMGNYFAERGHITAADLGRKNITGLDEDKHVFRVPSLRNVELTAPYFHDGSVKTLGEAVNLMGRYQLGVVIPERDRSDIVAFLRTLTGEYKEGTR